MAQKITIAVDALGGDAGASVVLPGVEAALNEDKDLHVILCGPQEITGPFADAHERCTAVFTTQEISMDEHPAQAVRKKKDSSLVVGCRQVKEGHAQGFFSAGSTGACLAAGTLVIGRIKGIARPALCTIIPSPVRPVVMCDVGANADCKPEYLVQFAQMATIYATHVMDMEDPNVALLNIGEEETKGSSFAQDSFALLRRSVPNFVGNIEGTEVLLGEHQIIVTDGFTGNVCIKTIEGTSSVVFDCIKQIFKKNPATMMAAALVKGGLKELKASVSPDTYGGAPLLGVQGACIVGHGSSNITAITNGIHTTAKTVRFHVSELIAQVADDSQASDTIDEDEKSTGRVDE